MVDDVGMPILVGLGKEPLVPGAAYPSCDPEAACDVLVVDKPDLLSEDAEQRSVLSNARRRGIPVMCVTCLPEVSAALGVGSLTAHALLSKLQHVWLWQGHATRLMLGLRECSCCLWAGVTWALKSIVM